MADWDCLNMHRQNYDAGKQIDSTHGGYDTGRNFCYAFDSTNNNKPTNVVIMLNRKPMGRFEKPGKTDLIKSSD